MENSGTDNARFDGGAGTASEGSLTGAAAPVTGQTAAAPGIHPNYTKTQYLFRKKAFKSIGGDFYVYDAAGELLFYARQKAFKLKEDFRLYEDETRTKELLTIKAPKIFDVNAVFNVEDITTGQVVGALKRKGLKSIIVDEWFLLSPDGVEIGKLSEENVVAALLSRWINLIPQSYVITDAGGRQVARIVQRFNPLQLKYDMTIGALDSGIDSRLIIAAGILIAGIEGRQG